MIGYDIRVFYGSSSADICAVKQLIFISNSFIEYQYVADVEAPF